MAHYLTPSKVALLTLLDLYTEDPLPPSSHLPILTFLTTHLTDPSPSTSSSSATSRFSKATTITSLLTSITPFRTLLEPHQLTTGIPGRRLYDSFVFRLWHINSLSALYEFFGRLPEALLAKSRDELRRMNLSEEKRLAVEAEVRFSRTSRFGLFVRNCCAEFEAARFDQVAELWKSLVAYRQETVDHLRKKVGEVDEYSFDSVLLSGQQEDWGIEGVQTLERVVYGEPGRVQGGKASVSRDDVEKLLEFQIDKMQKYNIRVPAPLQQQLQSLLSSTAHPPSSLHYTTFLSAWRANDHPTAVDSLHRYFDFIQSSSPHDTTRPFYQYALLNLGVIQAEFGCYSEAVDAMLETVSSARENRDVTCLNFALNWLFHFGRANPAFLRKIEASSTMGSEKETLAFLRVKAKEAGMWTLWAAVFQTEATLGLSHGESVAAAWENMVRSSQVIIQQNLKQIFAPQMLLRISLWDRLGVSSLSQSSCKVFLGAHAVDAIFEDELRATCRLAWSLTNRGQYASALTLLDSLDQESLRVGRLGQYALKYRAMIKLRRDLAHNNLDGAEELLAQLLQSKHDNVEPCLGSTLDALHIDLLTRRGDLSAAFALVEGPLQAEKPDDVAAHQTRLLLHKAALFAHAQRPLRGFTITVRALSLALRSRLVPLLWQAVSCLSAILVQLEEFDATVQLLQAVIPRVLESDAAYLTASLYATLADAHVGLAGQAAGKNTRARREHVANVVAALDAAFAWFSAVEDSVKMREMVAKKAVVMKVVGEGEVASQEAARYAALVKGEQAVSA